MEPPEAGSQPTPPDSSNTPEPTTVDPVEPPGDPVEPPDDPVEPPGGGDGEDGDQRVDPIGPFPLVEPEAYEFPGDVVPVVSLDTIPADYPNQWGLEAINLEEAHAHIIEEAGDGSRPGNAVVTPGTGVVVGVFDTGVHHHHAFPNTDIRGWYWGSPLRGFGIYGNQHGTRVAGVIAAIAPGVSLESYAIQVGSASGPYTPISYDSLANVGDESWQTKLDFVLDRDIDILNVSLGYNGIIDNYLKAELEKTFIDTVNSLAQADKLPEDRVLLVWAAGNAHGGSCVREEGGISTVGIETCVDGSVDAVSVELLPGLASRFEELRGHSVAVVAVEEDSNDPEGPPVIAEFSNRCGIAKEYCIAAPGRNITVTTYQVGVDVEVDNGEIVPKAFISQYGTGHGTSYAAPMVAGGLALIMHRFRQQISPQQALRILFARADKSGTYADQDIYGQGLMDLEAVTTEDATTGIIIGSSIADASARLRNTRLAFGPAFGTSPLRALAGREVAAFDSEGYPFWHDLGSFANARGISLERRLSRMLAAAGPGGAAAGGERESHRFPEDLRAGFARRDPGFAGVAGPALGLAWARPGSRWTATAFTTEGRMGQPPATGAALSWRPLGLRVGLVSERASSLGTVAEGGFGELSASTVYAGIERKFGLGSWRIDADVEAGYAEPAARRGILSAARPMTAFRMGLRATRELDGWGALAFSLDQPLRVERARATLTIPVGRTRSGRVLKESVPVDFEPTGRQIDFSAWWHGPDNGRGQIRLGATSTRHTGHNSAARPAMSLLAGYRLEF